MGAELKGNYPMSMLTPGAGLNITVFSYVDKFQFGLMTSPAFAPDIQAVAASVTSEFEALKKQLVSGKYQKKTTKKTSAKKNSRPVRKGLVVVKNADGTKPENRSGENKATAAKPPRKATTKARTSAKAAKPAKVKTGGRPATRKATGIKSTNVKKSGAKKATVKKAASKKTGAKKATASI